MIWRYQPVYQVDVGGVSVGLCECHFDAEGKLESWTEDPCMAPSGETVAELWNDLAQMMTDASMWVCVPFEALQVGMTFEQTEGGQEVAMTDRPARHVTETSMAEPSGWQPIETAPRDRPIVVYAPERDGLQEMASMCQWHPDAGFCIDELREPTHWMERPTWDPWDVRGFRKED